MWICLIKSALKLVPICWVRSIHPYQLKKTRRLYLTANHSVNHAEMFYGQYLNTFFLQFQTPVGLCQIITMNFAFIFV